MKKSVDNNQLDERKKKILCAIIRNYLDSGEPVGSRTISKYTDLNLSSATIRNEMSDLEEMGLIIQPHTSAGRIPTDKAYRLYVDDLMVEKDKEIQELKGLLLETEGKMDTMLKNVAKVLATNTNYATVVSSPQVRGSKLKFIQLSRIDETQILAVIVSEGNVIKNNMIRVSEPIDEETILKLNILLNTHLNGLSLEQISLGMIANLKQQAGIHSDIVGEVLDSLADAFKDDEDLQIYTSGATNILKYPELTDAGKASELINTFEEKEMFTKLVNDSLENETENGIQVYIGEESNVSAMKDCSVVTTTYDLGDGMKGSIAIIGPKRMDYEKVVASLKTMMTELDKAYKKGPKAIPDKKSNKKGS